MPIETPVQFDCQGKSLQGILHEANASIGVLIVVGGPQYRVGSHRQFVLLARYLAQHNISCLRFDVRGMGDSSGEPRDFSQLDADIQAAVDYWFSQRPDLQKIVLWGLCDGASAACSYAYQDPRINGLVLLNPWVYTEQGSAKTYLKHYYLQRLLSPELWRKIFTLNFDYRSSWQSLSNFLKRAQNTQPATTEPTIQQLALPQRMAAALQQFQHPVCILLSGRDLVADEFRDLVKQDSQWQALLASPTYTLHQLDAADHTFSTAAWRQQAADWTLHWLQSLK